ncbi:MAG: YkgJ family cysteine cluster protein [Bacteroidales bacterium]
MIDLQKLKEQADKAVPLNKKFFKGLKKNQLRDLDDTIHYIHEEVFDEINCLECANCCRSLGPRITDRDIEKIALATRMKPHEVINRYLRIDEDKDYVFKTMPCPFLMDDNYCSIYENRPKACREYPHTDRKKFFQISMLTIKNSYTCPAVYEILERLRNEL